MEERFSRLESRKSADGTQTWLNWVVRLPGGELAGYVQATVFRSGQSLIAYELASRFWRQGIGRSAVSAMMSELHASHDMHTVVAILKTANYRSLGLLRSLGFRPAFPEQALEFSPQPDETVMVKRAAA